MSPDPKAFSTNQTLDQESQQHRGASHVTIASRASQGQHMQQGKENNILGVFRGLIQEDGCRVRTSLGYIVRSIQPGTRNNLPKGEEKSK